MGLWFREYESPVGRLRLVASEDGLRAVLWEKDRPEGGSLEEKGPARVRLGEALRDDGNAVLRETERQLREYFAGERREFTLPLAAEGTEFQLAVWRELCGIPFGETRSYGELAVRLGRPGASRAVGAANGRNPLSIVVPCHRVVGIGGGLTGFAGGLEVKARLLELEGAQGGLFGRS